MCSMPIVDQDEHIFLRSDALEPTDIAINRLCCVARKLPKQEAIRSTLHRGAEAGHVSLRFCTCTHVVM